MKRQSPKELQSAMKMVKALADGGIPFLPIPVLDYEQTIEAIAITETRLNSIEVQISADDESKA